jgi:hypothetical protein
MAIVPELSIIRQKLSAHYAFTVPEAFAVLVRNALSGSCIDECFQDHELLGYYPFFDFYLPAKIDFDYDSNEFTFEKEEGFNEIYCYGVPPELYVIGTRDSIRFGYIVHDPSLPQTDFSIGKVAENEHGVISYGNDSKAGISSLIGFALYRNRELGQEQEPHALSGVEKMNALAAELGIHPTLEQFGAVDYGNNSAQAVPKIPAGWHFEQSTDGIGALAPKETFAPEKTEFIEETAVARKLLDDEHYGTALLALRNTLWRDWHSNKDPFHEECAVLLQETYNRLGRPLFAHRVQKQIDYMRTLKF